MRDTEKYLYIEIALPREHPAVQQMLAEAERLAIPLRTLIRTTCLQVYGDGAPLVRPASKPAPKPPAAAPSAEGIEINAQALSSADDFLDEMGM